MKNRIANLAKSAYEKLSSSDTSDLDKLRKLSMEGDSEAMDFLILLEGARSGLNKKPELSRKLGEYFPEYKSIRNPSAKDVYAGMVQSAFDRMT